MIESLYWKEELDRISKSIRPVAKPKRWSERAVCTVERDVTIGFFITRRMLELKKVSSHITKLEIDVFSAPVTKSITRLNSYNIEENYDWAVERFERRPALYICNQCIHAYLSFVMRGPDRNWSDLIVVSDFDRNKLVWRIPFPTIIGLFDTASKDWPTWLHMDFDPKLGDYRITTN